MVDFGIRGFDLTMALLEDVDLVILVDARPRGGSPGTLYVIEPEPAGQANPPSGIEHARSSFTRPGQGPPAREKHGGPARACARGRLRARKPRSAKKSGT